MALSAGTRLGPYELVAPVGAGGMGEVYRAKDTRLDRTVAVKVLPAHLSASADSRQRFEREAKTISQLSHPHICALYDVGNQDGVEFLVMEYLEGETLSDRLLKGPLAFDQVLRYGIEIADALDKAHRQGIVHRDLKPGNVMITKSGVKLLDFGLAKAIAPPSSPAQLTTFPTQAALTQEGTILGTFQYMAPEQLEGKEADARTDIFAFGAVLYEMATGQKAFSGKTQASLIAAIIERVPPVVSTISPMTPLAFDRVVKTCLAKDPEDRWQTAHDVMLELKWVAEGGSAAGLPAPVVAERKPRDRALWAAIGFAIGAVASGLGLWALLHGRDRAFRPVTRYTITLPAAGFLTGVLGNRIAISPDGRRLAYIALEKGQTRIYTRRMDEFDFTPVPGTEGGGQVFSSPDGEWLGFSVMGAIRKVSVAGGMPLPVVTTSAPLGIVWTPDDSIWWGSRQGLMRVHAGGGAPQVAAKLEKGESSIRAPQILPGGKAVLFTTLTSASSPEVAALSLETGKRTSLARPGFRSRYVEPGFLLYTTGQDSPLLAVRFDSERLEVHGSPVPVTQNSVSQFDVSRNGTLIYLSGSSDHGSELVWADSKGTSQAVSTPQHFFEQPRISPDGRSIAVANREGNPDVWVYSIDRGTLVRLTFDPEEDETPTWSPDGRRVTYRRANKFFSKSADGSGSEELLASVEGNAHIGNWSPDGRFLAYSAIMEGGEDIYVLSRDDKWASRVFLKTPYNERGPMFSPDGRWVAYTSDESGRDEVYVQPFPGPGGRWQVSTQGGSEPMWARDGNQLFYMNGNRLMTAVVKSEPAFAAAQPQLVFDGPYLRAHREHPNYDVSPDGKRFIVVSGKEVGNTPLYVVQDWFGELEQRVRKR